MASVLASGMRTAMPVSRVLQIAPEIQPVQRHMPLNRHEWMRRSNLDPLHAPEVAHLGLVLSPLEVRPGSESIEMRPPACLSLTIDYRVLDGRQTNAWLSAFVEQPERWPLEGT